MNLPKSLSNAINNGSWQGRYYDYEITSLLDRLGLNQSLKICYYGFETITKESTFFHGVMKLNMEEIDIFVGEYSKLPVDKTIAPELTMLIADFGLGSDQPIALDYRKSIEKPEVWMLKWNSNMINHWTKVSSSFENFIQGKE